MKKILFLATNRVHLARQKLLLDKLREEFEVDILEIDSPKKDILNVVADVANTFRKTLEYNKYDLVVIRGDRFEMLAPTMMAAYRGIKIAHIEGGDMSGAIDNKVRHAITTLSDIHFATNKESFARLINMGTDPIWTFDFGSLDVEYAKSIEDKRLSSPNGQSRKRLMEEKKTVLVPYVVVCFHPMPGESPNLVEEAVREVWSGDVIVIKSNKDNGSTYGTEEYSPEAYAQLIAEAKCLVGNSSSFLKEASIFGTPVINVGERQKNRLKSDNVKDCKCDKHHIKKMLELQLNETYAPSNLYYKPDTSQKICVKIKEFLG